MQSGHLPIPALYDAPTTMGAGFFPKQSGEK
jgi:hypothetical protein